MASDNDPQTGQSQTPLQRAFSAMRAAETKLEALERATREPIAIIGLGCRVPGGGQDANSFWSLLRDGVDAVTTVPQDRWDHDHYFDPDPEAPGKISTRFGGFLEQIDQFDPGFFGIAPREAQGMDPQQRLLLEVCWETLEHASQAPDGLNGSATGLFVGAAASDYAYLQLKTGDPSLLDAHFASGIAHSTLSGRISYLLGLQGPSVTLDTACSSSLVAVHQACQALRTGDCDLALAGGVNLILGPDIFVALSQARMLAPDGRCKAFSADADGFGRAEGCGMIALKRLSDAKAGGDRILATIRGSAVNQDGASSGLTAPNGPAQESVIRTALKNAGVAASSVGYIEAHGTGTSLGDPIEAHALGQVFTDIQDRSEPVIVGSVKSNFGHLEAAAGITGLIKLALSLHHQRIPQSLHCNTPSPYIDWDRMPLALATDDRDWPEINGTRIGGVSSFGFSGTNAHIVLEQAPRELPTEPEVRTPQILAVSAHGPEAALLGVASRYASSIEALSQQAFANFCLTANKGKAHLEHRAIAIADSPEECAQSLSAFAEGADRSGIVRGRLTRQDPPRTAFLFTGQGSQHIGMGKQLYETEPVFRKALDRCATALDPKLRLPLLDVMFGNTADDKLIDQTEFAQPALFSLEYALTQLWRSWGVEPDFVAGHSVGEFVAATIAGVFSLEDALTLICERGRLMQSLPKGGAMTSISASQDAVTEMIAKASGQVVIAAVNASAQITVSGEAEAVQQVCSIADAQGVNQRALPVSHAFHSPLVEPVLDQFERVAAQISMSPPKMRLISNLTGGRAGPEIATARYWRDHMRNAVMFRDCMSTLMDMKPDLIIEIGPQAALLPLVHDACNDDTPVLACSLRKSEDDRRALLGALAKVYLAGATIHWQTVADPGTSVTDVPSYPFQRSRYWFSARSASSTGARATDHPLLSNELFLANQQTRVFETTLAASDFAFLTDHVVRGKCIAPGAMFVEMALAAGREVFSSSKELADIFLVEPMSFDSDVLRSVQTTVTSHDAGDLFEIASAEQGSNEWTLHVKGRFTEPQLSEDSPPNLPVSPSKHVIEAEEHYDALSARGLEFGQSLRLLDRIEVDQNSVTERGHMTASGVLGSVTHADGFLIGPALLDACLQVIACALPADIAKDRVFLPFSFGRVIWLRAPGDSLRATVTTRSSGSDNDALLQADLAIHDKSGLVGQMEGILLRPARAAADEALYVIDWVPYERAADKATLIELERATSPLLSQAANENALAAYNKALPDIDVLATRWILQGLRTLGWSPEPGERVDLHQLAQSLDIAPNLYGQLRRYMEILAEDGIVIPLDADRVEVIAMPDPGQPDQLTRSALETYPASCERLTLMAACGPNLGPILKGDRNPVEDLFPNGDMSTARALYRDTPEAKTYNKLAAAAVRAFVDRRNTGHPIRILEVGAGSGGTTASVLPALHELSIHYTFTDIGPALVSRAKEEFSNHPNIEFSTFDLERDPQEQGFELESFDIIIGANAIHATSDLTATIGRLRSLLAHGGCLFMLEITERERWVDLTFGLTEGWWLFNDTNLRKNYPLLSNDEWLHLLNGTGFSAISLVPPHEHSSQTLIAAQKADATAPDQVTQWIVLGDADGIAGSIASSARAVDQDTKVLQGFEGGSLSKRIISKNCMIVYLQTLSDNSATEKRLDNLRKTVRSIASTSFGDAGPKLAVVTRQSQTVTPGDSISPGQSAIWGMALAIAEELPELDPHLLDIDATASPDDAAGAIISCLTEASPERQFAMRRGSLFVPRLVPAQILPQQSENAHLVKGRSGTLEDISLVESPRRAPGAGEVELRVIAAGLNLRDVMNALDMRDDPEPLGGECVAEISAVGDGVSRWRIGDRVVALAEAALGRYAIAQATEVAPLPGVATPVEGATLPFAFMTAHYSLIEKGGLRPDDWVLIHAAAGGVGSAAIQIAQKVGANVIATAGSPEKRAWLRDKGVEHVFSSRTLEFSQEVHQITGGRGADLALNALSGEFITATVSCLAPMGRFIEIGKRGIWTTEEFHKECPNGQYHVVDIAQLRADSPKVSAALFQDVIRRVENHEFSPLHHSSFALESANEAFQYMARADHIGKVVLLPDPAPAEFQSTIRPDASYLITGGLRGLGLLTARYLADCGARTLFLAGRSAPDSQTEAVVSALTQRGVSVSVCACDISSADQVGHLFNKIADGHPPLRGIVHAAGLLADGSLSQIDAEGFAIPFGPKIDGSLLLHQHSISTPLDFFVMYSSLSGAMGSAGQTNHAAANAFMDGLAHCRKSMGLPAVSIGWGAWSGVGIAADQSVDKKLRKKGIESIGEELGLALLNATPYTGQAHVIASPFRWRDFLTSRRGRILQPLIEHLEHAAKASKPAPVGERADTVGAPLASALAGAADAKRSELIFTYVTAQVAETLGQGNPDLLDPERPLREMGLDSLMAVDLRNRLSSAFPAANGVPSTLVFDHSSINALSDHLGALYRAATPVANDCAEPRAATTSDTVAEIDALTDDEIDALIAAGRRENQ
ncbi:SDR family NAD(P)-dependent oxidoreductase [Ruegeria sp. 2012CJ41-6]|uniref:SDR family NAD(P)-dependent oxidoreductase n=1 Tax=Ruegeria spongiae TaxID=2942209 RepID=A0ABT0Q5N3_9RHOB|nr:type I polyketide synthase [Ruegeria spongiae]MCL6285140.1 SDR family NAD(P)-dependent oxidoreductase [Ruegeria spongiae]